MVANSACTRWSPVSSGWNEVASSDPARTATILSPAAAGTEDGHELFGHSIIVNPQGEIMAQATSWDDELIVAEADLGMCELGRTTIFNFANHRRPEAYGRITAQVGSEPPAAWTPSRG